MRELYLHRLQPIADRDDAEGALTREVARYLALWMSYEDVIRVADLKTRARAALRACARRCGPATRISCRSWTT